MGLAEADTETSHKYQGQYLMSHNLQVLVLFVILIALWFFKVWKDKIKPMQILRRIADANLHAWVGGRFQSENSSQLSRHRWLGHPGHLHVHPSLHSSTGPINPKNLLKSFS